MTKSYKVGTVFLSKVTFVSSKYFLVRTSNHEKGIVYINETSDYFVNDLSKLIKVGDVLYLPLKEIKDDDTLVLSFKENRTFLLRTPFDFKINANTQEHDFQNLYEFTNKEIKKWKKSN